MAALYNILPDCRHIRGELKYKSFGGTTYQGLHQRSGPPGKTL